MIRNLCGFEVDVVYKRVKNINLRVTRDGEVKLSLPLSCPISVAEEFLSQKSVWVKKHINRKTRHSDALKNGTKLLILGNVKKILFVYSSNKSISEDGKVITVYSPENLAVKFAEHYIKNLFLSYIQSRVMYFEQLTGLKSNGISVRKMKSKWGCCDVRTNKLTFSLYLAFRPLHCIDYVVLHELVHTRIAAHNDSFYSVIKNYMPDYKVRIKELREY